METINEKLLNEYELRELFIKWMKTNHSDKINPKITAIKKDKIYFIYEGSNEESLIHTKLLQDLFDRDKI